MNLSNINQENVFAKSVIGNVRTKQEDCCGMSETPNGDVFVVCDGVGGNVGGEKASAIAVDSVVEFFRKEKYSNVPQAINDALHYANQKILDYASVYREYVGMATTICVLLLQDKNAFIAHIGDSRIYIYLGKEKELHRITKDHSYVQTLVDAGEITDEEAETHPRKNIILKSLGYDTEVEPTIDMLQPKNDDIFLLCTDGFNGMISDKTIENILKLDVPLELKGERLVDLAMQGEDGRPGGLDNCTLQLIRIDNSPWSKSEFTSYNPIRQEESESTSLTTEETPSSEEKEKPKRKFSLEKILYILIPLLIIATCFIFTNKDKEKKISSETEMQIEETIVQDTMPAHEEIVMEPEIEVVQTPMPEQEIKPTPEPESKPEKKEQSYQPKTIYTKNVSFGVTKVVESEAEYRISYKVKKGDNISEICQMFGCTQSDFKKWNNLKNNNIGAGMVYVVKPQKKNIQCKVYTVKKNEILANIAKKNNAKMDDVITCNGLKNPNSIQPGQKLIIVVKR